MVNNTIIDFRQGVWVDGDGVEHHLKALPDDRIRNIERWLRGSGATLPPEGMFEAKYSDVDAEMQRRGLEPLEDHEQAYLREIWHVNKSWLEAEENEIPDDGQKKSGRYKGEVPFLRMF